MRDGWKVQRFYSRRVTLLISLALLFLVLQSCRANEVDSVGSEVAAPSDSTDLYLKEVIPPCVPLWDSSHDPCPSEVPTDVEIYGSTGSIRRWPSQGFPTWTDILLGKLDGDVSYVSLTIHLVVRGEAKIGSTRCESYPRRLASYWNDRVEPGTNFIELMENSGLDYHCYMEIGVKEYIVGSGPSVLTVSMHREPVEWWALEFDDWPKELLNDPQSRAAIAYEGKELILFLGMPFTIAVESFEVGSMAGLWFVQKDGDEVRSVAQDVRYARTEEQRSRLDLPLNDLVEQVKRGATERTAITDGRIGVAPYLPLLVTDANHLRDYYVSVGAVYDGTEGATVLPPPVPGEGDIVPVTVPVDGGEVTVVSSVPVPGEDTGVPPSTDDARLTVGQESTTTTLLETTTTVTETPVTTTSEVAESTTTTIIPETVTGTTTTTVVPVSTTVVPSGEDTPPLAGEGLPGEDQVTPTSSTVVDTTTTSTIAATESLVTTVVVPAVTTTSEVVESTTTTIPESVTGTTSTTTTVVPVSTTVVPSGEDTPPLVGDGASEEGQVTTTSSTVVQSPSATSSTTTLPDGDEFELGEDPFVAPPADDGEGAEGPTDAGRAVGDG